MKKNIISKVKYAWLELPEESITYHKGKCPPANKIKSYWEKRREKI